MVNKYNNTYHRAIKMELLDVKSSKHIDFEAESNDKDPNFKVDDVRISKYKIIFEKGYIRNWPEEVFVIKKVNSTVP